MASSFINLNAVVSNDAKEYLDIISDEAAQLANHFVGKASKNARGMAQEIEAGSGRLNIERGKQYFRKHTVANKNDRWGGMHTTESYWDSTTKSYRTKNAKAAKRKSQRDGNKDLRLQNFSFTKGAGGKRSNNYNSRAESRLTSNIANLHERDVYFPKGSIWFSRGLMSPFKRFKKGQTRRGRHFFDKYSSAVLSTLGKSEIEALEEFDKKVMERTKGI